jgi:hypothetical protein
MFSLAQSLYSLELSGSLCGLQEVQKNFHQLMQTLACFDLMYILLSMVMFGLPSTLPW